MPNESAVKAAKDWIAGLTDEQQKEFAGISEVGLEHLGQGVLRQADYTQKTTNLKADREKLEKWRNEANDQYSKMREENVGLKGKVTEAQARLEALAKDYGIDVEEIKLQQQATGQSAGDAAAAVSRQGGQAVQGGQEGAVSGGIDRSYVDQSMDTIASIAFQATDLAQDHRELFGERLVITDFMQEAAKAGKPLKEYWEEKYNVSGKRKELEDREKTEWEERIRKEEADKVRSQLLSDGYQLQPTASADLGKSPLFDPNFGKELFSNKGEGADNQGSGEGGRPGQRTEKDRAGIIAAAVKAFESEGRPKIAEAQARGEI